MSGRINKAASADERPVYRAGDRLLNRKDGRAARIVAIAEGYAMIRYKGAAPFVLPLSEVFARFSIAS